MRKKSSGNLRSWLSRWLHRLLLLTAVAFLVLYMLVLSPVGQKLLVREATRNLQNLLAGRVELKGARTDFWSRIDLYGLSVVDTSGAGGMLTIGHARLSYFPPALLRRRFVIRKISLDKVVADVQRTRSGQFPLLRRRRADTTTAAPRDTVRRSGSRFRIVIRSLQLRDARLRYRDEGLKIDAGLADVRGRIHFVGPDSLDIRVESGGGYANTPWWNGLVDEVVAEGRLGSHGLRLRSAKLNGPTVEIAGHGFVPFQVEGGWNLTAHARSAIGSITVLKRVLPQLGEDGLAEAEASWTGPLSHPVLKLNLLGLGLTWGDLPVDSLSAEARYLSDQVLRGIVDVRGPVFRGEVREEVSIPLLLRRPRIGAYRLACRVDSLDYEWLRRRFRIPTRTRGGSISGQCWANGDGLHSWPAELRLTATLDGWRGPDSSSVPLLADVSLQDSKWRVQLFWAANALRGAGRLVESRSLDGEVVLDLGEPAVPALYFLGETVDGHLRGRAQVVGPVLNPAVWLTVTGKNVRWSGVQLDSLWLRGHAREGRLRVTGSSAALLVDLPALGAKLGTPGLEGSVRAFVQARGLFPRLKVEGEFAGRDVGYAAWSADSLSGRAVYSDDTLRWTQLQLRKDTSRVRSHGQLVLRPGGLDVQSDLRFALVDSETAVPGGVSHVEFALTGDTARAFLAAEALDLSGLRAWIPTELKLRGHADLTAQIHGSLDNPAGTAKLKIREVGWKRWQVAEVGAAVSLSDSLLRVRGRTEISDSLSAVDFAVTCPFTPHSGWGVDTSATRPFVARARSDSLDLACLSQFLPIRAQVGGRGSLRGALHRSGSAWLVSGEASVEGGTLSLPRPGVDLRQIDADAEVAGALPLPQARLRLTAGHSTVAKSALDSLLVELSLNDQGDLQVSRFTGWAGGGTLTVRGTLPGVVVGGPPRFQGDLEVSSFPVAFANAYTGSIRIVKGALSGEASVDVGKTSGFQGRGSLELLGGRLRLGPVEPDLTNLRFQVSLEGDSLVVHELGGSLGTGGFAGKGFLVFEQGGLSAADLSVDGKGLSFALPDVADVRISELSASLANREESERFLLAGKVVLGESRFVRDLRLGDLVDAFRGASPRPKKTNPFLEKLDLDLALIVPQSLVVDVNLGKMRLDGQLALSQKAVRPAVTGEFRVVDGYIFYLDRKFEIEEATFRQLEPFRINPEINFRAVAEVRPIQATEGPTVYRVTLSLTGDLEHPKLQLQSEPPLSQADIVSLLTIGRVRGAGNVASEGEMGISEILVQRAKSITSQQVTGLAARQMERLLNLESVTIEGNLFQTNQVWGPRVTITKRLAERLNLTYQTVVGHTNEQRVRISYRINPYLYLTGETDELGRAGIDLIARLRFK